MTRRLVYALDLVLLANYNFFQIQIIVYKTMFVLILVGQI